MQFFNKLLLLASCSIFALLALGSCHTNNKSSQTADEDSQQSARSESADLLFSADSAYSFIAKQVAFGPRVPNTPQHKACGDWLVEVLSSYGAAVSQQEAVVDTHKETKLPIRNIIASFNQEVPQRILLLAHWDTRPMADNDPSPALQKKPILGADDGGSGVAVLLEIARLMQATNSKAPIDILLVDAEDMGESNVEESWCLGSTYWSKHPHIEGYKADFGILLDMVGAKEARFLWEYFSKSYAPGIVSEVWKKAVELGYGKSFINADGAALTDDHIPIIKNLGIPTIDIVNYDVNRQNGFGDHWHTHADNLEIIDKEVLRAVGNTVWEVIHHR